VEGTSTAQPVRQRRLLIAILAVVFTAALDLTSVAPLLPDMITDLRINPVDADRYAWIVLAYLIAYTITVPLTGRISDAVGRMPVFAVALGLFAAGSIVVASTDSLGGMIAGRTIQGLGGGAMLPVSMALVADVVPPARRAAALGLVAAADTFGWVLGPVYGSAVEGIFGSWRWVFWTNLPVCAIAAVALIIANREVHQLRVRKLPNPASALLATIGLLTVTMALATGGEGGISPGQGAATLGGSVNPVAPYRWYLLASGLAALVGFVFSERRAAVPLLPVDLIRQRVFRFAAGANLLAGAALVVSMVNAPLVVALLADQKDASMRTAVLLGGFTLGMTTGAIIGGRLVNAAGTRLTASAGLVLAAIGYVLMSNWPNSLEMPVMTATIAVTGIGLGLVIAPLADAAIGVARMQSYGAASGLVLLARLLGMTFGLAAITRFSLDRLDGKVATLDAPSPLPGESTTDYFVRQQEYFDEQIIPLTLDVIHETFLIAAVLCLLTIVVVAGIRAGKTASDAPPTEAR
jgi:MFS family permease